MNIYIKSDLRWRRYNAILLGIHLGLMSGPLPAKITSSFDHRTLKLHIKARSLTQQTEVHLSLS